jgi:2-phospho-L-lactate guanylyltransferase
VVATAIIPVKRFGHAKQRLLDELDRPQRAALVKAMLEDVLRALDASDGVERVIVVTGEGRAERIALRHARRSATALEVLRDPNDRGHSEAAVLGIIRALSLGAECAALLPGDCPLLDPAELDAALDRMRPGRVAVIPDRHGTGTNGLLLAPADAIGPAFGPGSAERHRDRAGRAGHEVATEELASLALDLDTPEDLEALATRLAEDPTPAPATTAALEGIGRLPTPRAG